MAGFGSRHLPLLDFSEDCLRLVTTVVPAHIEETQTWDRWKSEQGWACTGRRVCTNDETRGQPQQHQLIYWDRLSCVFGAICPLIFTSASPGLRSQQEHPPQLLSGGAKSKLGCLSSMAISFLTKLYIQPGARLWFRNWVFYHPNHYFSSVVSHLTYQGSSRKIH